MALSFEAAEELIYEFCKTYPQAHTITYNLAEHQEEIYGPENTVALRGRISGSYRAASRGADFALANSDSNEKFERTLRHEILGHFGINTFKPDEKRAVLNAIIEARSEVGLETLWGYVDRLYPGQSDMRNAEEVYALACEAIEPSDRSAAIDGQKSYDDVCVSRTRAMRISDLINLTTMVAEGLHDSTRSQQTFPESDSAQFKQDTPMKTSEYPVWLAVQPDDRDKMRTAAGQLSDGRSAVAWDKEEKLWFARPGCDLDRVQEWMPDRSIRAGGGDPESEFLDTLTQAGLVIKGMPVMNGKRQRVATTDDKGGKTSGVYCGYLDRRPAGWFINYHRAESSKDVTNWTATGGDANPLARLHIRAAAKQSQEDATRERAELHAERTLAAKTLYDQLPAADPSHPYLVRKGIPSTPELRQTRNGALVVPFFSAQGNFKTLQYIPETGDKLLFKDAPKKGNFLVVGGPLEPGQPILYAEGYATARSLNLATERPVVMTIDAGNMVTVAQILHQQFPDSPHVFLADFDHAKDENKGLIMATEAASKVGGQVLYPAFNEREIAQGFTDFNDLHQSRGLDAVRDQTAPLFMRHDEVTTVPDQPNVEGPSIQAKPFSLEELQGSVAIPTRDDAYADAAGPSSRFSLEEMQGSVPISTRDDAYADAITLSPDGSAVPVAPEALSVVTDAATLGTDTHPEAVLPNEPLLDVPLESAAPITTSTSAESAGPALDEARSEPVLSDAMPTPAPADPDRVVTPELGQLSPGQPLDAEPTEATAPLATVAQAAPQVGQADQEAEPAVVAPIAVNSAADAEPEAPAKVAEDLVSLLPRPRAGAKAPAAEPVVDSIDVGPRIGKDEPPLQPSQIDKDNLLTRITNEPQGDNSVLYKLDNEPAFVDRGSRLEMAPGAGQSDEKILAALLTAARFYRGQIELTGSDAFKAKAIELIVLNQVNVSMKNPAQQLILDQSRQALNLPVVKADAIHGDTPAPFDPAPPATPAMVSTTAGGTVPLSPAVTEQQAAPMLVNTAANNAYVPFDVPVPVSLVNNAAQAGPVDDAPPLGSAPQAQEIKPGVQDGSRASGTGVDPAIHQLSTSAVEGVTGKVMSCGKAPFRFDPANSESVHITLRTKTGIQTFWGKELAGLLRETRIEPGRMATLQYLGEKPVTVKTPVKDPETGLVWHYEDKQAKRNQWSLGLLNGTAVRTGDDQGVKLVAYDAARFAMIQNSIMSQLNVPIEEPPRPGDGLFWMTPNGQGSAKAGDGLSAPRPPVDDVNVGKPVMSSWSQDGQLDMALFRGDGPYLQGVMRQGNEYQHVLVSLPGHAEAPPMVINQITEQGLVPIGVGNGINRSGGEPVAREHIAFKLDGDPAVRIGKLDFPAEMPPALHVRLGFDERWKDTNTLPKSPPAAAPMAEPSALRPS
jgi:putative DNA primase/helicase